MEAIMEHLTTTEAAVAAGVSLPQVNRVIDERILPDDWYSTSPTRTVRTDACLLISFYFETADWLTASARLQTIRNAVAHGHTWGAVEELRRRRSLSDGPLCLSLEERGRPIAEAHGRRANGGGRPRDFKRDAGHSRNPRASPNRSRAVRRRDSDGTYPEVLSQRDRIAGGARFHLREGGAPAGPPQA